MKARLSPKTKYLLALGLSGLTSIGLFLYESWRSHDMEYTYLVWNLFLSWIPLILALWLVRTLKRKLWSSWEALATTILWLLFLPNSFYMISDFIHLQSVAPQNVLYVAVMFTVFIATGVILGFSSLYLVHVQLKKRFRGTVIMTGIAGILLACSVAMYIGRDLRWNSWDIFTNPGGVLFDMSDRLMHPAAYPQMFLTIVSFFVVIFSLYNLVWRSVVLLQDAASS